MREILFRGKRVDNGEWAESEYPYGTISCGVVRHNFDHDTIGQYTGFTDKNGTKIFEGDIVNYFGKDFLNSLVTFDKGSFWFEFLSEYTRKIRNQKRDLIFSNVSVCGEVIGNIYDNPELIEDMDIKPAAKMSDAPRRAARACSGDVRGAREMKNRQHYITRKNEHDMMMDIRLNTNGCPIYILTGRSHLHEKHGTACILNINNCSRCINNWLNREVET